MANDSQHKLPVLIVAPFGRDGQLIAHTLQEAEIDCELHHDPRVVFPRLSNGTGAVLLEEEASIGELTRSSRRLCRISRHGPTHRSSC